MQAYGVRVYGCTGMVALYDVYVLFLYAMFNIFMYSVPCTAVLPILFYDTVPVPVGRTYQYHLYTMIQESKTNSLKYLQCSVIQTMITDMLYLHIHIYFYYGMESHNHDL